MKHSLKITLILVFMFLFSQIIGLLIINNYIDHPATATSGKVEWKALPYNIERPQMEENTSVWYIIIAILIGTGIALLIIRFNKIGLWKFWFFLSVSICLTIALGAFMPQIYAIIIAVILAAIKAFKPNTIVHNSTELFVYGGLAAIFVPILNVWSAAILLILISIYDAYAVWKSKHMVTLAKFTSKSNAFAGLFVPYDLKQTNMLAKKEDKSSKKTTLHQGKKSKNAILGGGDIGFPLLFSGVVMKTLFLSGDFNIFKFAVLPICVTLSLFILLMKAEKDKFYPAMPFITAGCFVGYLFLYLLGLF